MAFLQKITKLVKKNIVLRVTARELVYWMKRQQYRHYAKMTPVEKRTVLFCVFGGKSFSCTPKAVYRYMKSSGRFNGWRYIWLIEDESVIPESERDDSTIIMQMSEAWKAFATAEYWFCNYNIPDYIYPKSMQTYVQCWHGTPLKRLGYDIQKADNAMNGRFEIRRRYRIDAKKFAYLLSPSAFCTDIFASAWNLRACNMTNKILEVGYPRNDSLFQFNELDVLRIKQNILKNEFEQSKKKKVILYAPTWRDNQYDLKIGYTYQPPIDFDKLQKELGKDYIILFRAHYLVANSFDFEKYKGFVYDVSLYPDINELYMCADLLITDYSSVLFDYANLKRPMIFYMYDLERYQEDIRGFYINLEEMPGPIVKTQSELISAIKYSKKYEKEYGEFLMKYNRLDDGKAAERLVMQVIKDYEG